MGNREPEIGVWERVYSGNPHEKSKWLTKPSKESELNCETAVCCHWTTRFHFNIANRLSQWENISG